MEWHFDADFGKDWVELFKEHVYGKKTINPHEKLPEEELVTEDEFITMMTGK